MLKALWNNTFMWSFCTLFNETPTSTGGSAPPPELIQNIVSSITNQLGVRLGGAVPSSTSAPSTANNTSSSASSSAATSNGPVQSTGPGRNSQAAGNRWAFHKLQLFNSHLVSRKDGISFINIVWIFQGWILIWIKITGSKLSSEMVILNTVGCRSLTHRMIRLC